MRNVSALQPWLPNLKPEDPVEESLAFWPAARPRRAPEALGPQRAVVAVPALVPESVQDAVKEGERVRALALAQLERRRERQRARALKLELSIADERVRTAARLAEQRAELVDLNHDERLATLLRLRQSGVPVERAIEEVDRRFPPRSAPRT